MNILYTITGLTLGGAETITVNLAHRMQQRGHTVAIMFLSGEQIVQIPNNITVYNLNMKKNPFGFIKVLFSARKIVKDFKPDVVHANMFHAIFFTRLLRLIAKIPKLICTEHSNNYHGKSRRFLEHTTDFLSDLNTNVSEQATQYFIDEGVFSKSKSIPMYNGVDLNRFIKNQEKSLRSELGISDSDYVFINVSRFNEAKDHKNLINAFNIVHKKNQNTKLICVGDGELFETVKKQSEELCLTDSMFFAGKKFNTENYYNSSDCFVLSSAWEGFGLVLVEAMACELEVISTDCGGTKEILQNDSELIPIRNSEKLAEKMIEVMKHSEQERLENGKSNREKVKKFDLNLITEKWEELYKNG